MIFQHLYTIVIIIIIVKVDNNVQKNIFTDILDKCIGNFIDSLSSKLNDDKKYHALTKTSRPNILYNFPKDNYSRKFQIK